MKNTNTINAKIPALNFIELLFALCIIGIITFIALPELKPMLVKARSLEAKTQLKHLYTLEQSYYYMNYKYSQSLEDIDYQHPVLVTNGGNAYYKIDVIEASSNTFRARATAITDFDGDGVFNVWEIDQDMKIEETVKD